MINIHPQYCEIFKKQTNKGYTMKTTDRYVLYFLEAASDKRLSIAVLRVFSY